MYLSFVAEKGRLPTYILFGTCSLLCDYQLNGQFGIVFPQMLNGARDKLFLQAALRQQCRIVIVRALYGEHRNRSNCITENQGN